MSQANGRAVLITGANGGIGAATASALVERGYEVHAGVRRASAAPAGTQPVELDVTDELSISRAVDEITRRLGGAGLHAVINNAGIIVQGPLELLPTDALHEQFAVNVYGPMATMRAFLPLLRQGSGRIVNISAVSALVAVPFFGPISASKAALESLSDAARLELAQWRIPVVIVEPGGVATEIFNKADAHGAAVLDEASPQRRAMYEPALAAFGKAAAKQKLGAVDVVVKAIVEALEARKPKARYTAGRDARSYVMLSRLPTRTRDRLLARALGLSKLPAQQVSSS